MEYFKVMYDSRVVIYERKMFIRLATVINLMNALQLYSRILKHSRKFSCPCASRVVNYDCKTFIRFARRFKK